jgi:hypothetical protein
MSDDQRKIVRRAETLLKIRGVERENSLSLAVKVGPSAIVANWRVAWLRPRVQMPLSIRHADIVVNTCPISEMPVGGVRVACLI